MVASPRHPTFRDSMFWHVTNRGRASWIYHRLRRVFVAPASDRERCWMGAPVDPAVHCPRRVDGSWCAHHQREIDRDKK